MKTSGIVGYNKVINMQIRAMGCKIPMSKEQAILQAHRAMQGILGFEIYRHRNDI